MSLTYFLIGLLGGIISTAVMTLAEIPSWKRWGLHGVFEWHENHFIAKRMFNLPNDNDNNSNSNLNYKGIFFFHFLNGSLAGIAFPFIISSFFTVYIDNIVSVVSLGIFYGLVLWIITLVPIHKPITGFSPWNHPLGHMPAIASLGGHIVYGAVLGLVILTFITH